MDFFMRKTYLLYYCNISKKKNYAIISQNFLYCSINVWDTFMVN